MAFEMSTIDELLKVVETIKSDTDELAELRQRVWPAIKDEPTPERILLVEYANRADKLAVAVAQIAGILASHLADEASLRKLDGGQGSE